ncbi:l-lactate dehydrogenase b chain isoform x1 [Limosa lapponica baueri]|uniref:L-lactate dehydrogenase b chain isoform x1 n=1 Tax=Limosa lapponica baueri TaxID=1758121 RepID=A0A2I0TGN8_LIMLA|nr:l-lactate dehydrogenase b chain isoform x1 [Limosa lapponica baueri]
MATLKEKLITPIAAGAKVPNTKISIVGAGQVGMACAISVLAKVRLKDGVPFRCPLLSSPAPPFASANGGKLGSKAGVYLAGELCWAKNADRTGIYVKYGIGIKTMHV